MSSWSSKRKNRATHFSSRRAFAPRFSTLSSSDILVARTSVPVLTPPRHTNLSVNSTGTCSSSLDPSCAPGWLWGSPDWHTSAIFCFCLDEGPGCAAALVAARSWCRRKRMKRLAIPEKVRRVVLCSWAFGDDEDALLEVERCIVLIAAGWL